MIRPYGDEDTEECRKLRMNIVGRKMLYDCGIAVQCVLCPYLCHKCKLYDQNPYLQ